MEVLSLPVCSGRFEGEAFFFGGGNGRGCRRSSAPVGPLPGRSGSLGSVGPVQNDELVPHGFPQDSARRKAFLEQHFVPGLGKDHEHAVLPSQMPRKVSRPMNQVVWFTWR